MGLSWDINIPKIPTIGKTRKTQETVLIWDKVSIPINMRTPPIFLEKL